MTITCLFATPDGDAPVRPQDRQQPFLLDPSSGHPVLTLGDYLDALAGLVSSQQALLAGLLQRQLGLAAAPEVTGLVIRSEKHGACAHIASLEVICPAGAARFCLTTAVAVADREALAAEAERLSALRRRGLAFLPRVHAWQEVLAPAAGHGMPLLVMLGEWLAGFHEWHLALGPDGRADRLCLWDMEQGHRLLSPAAGDQVFRQAARLLTLAYDPVTGCQITPWHHAAGDFIVQEAEGRVAVRLITARGYQPLLEYGQPGEPWAFIPLVSFFLDLMTRIRLDRLDGVGRLVLADRRLLAAALDGFLAALAERGAGATAGQLVALLAGCQPPELAQLHAPLDALGQEGDPEEWQLVARGRQQHLADLAWCLQRAGQGGR
ncbi:MAG: hypothetical protein AB1634_12695 [Thermodesulfobacteriota bacterium]